MMWEGYAGVYLVYTLVVHRCLCLMTIDEVLQSPHTFLLTSPISSCELAITTFLSVFWYLQSVQISAAGRWGGRGDRVGDPDHF